jgi:hypothetical protein
LKPARDALRVTGTLPRGIEPRASVAFEVVQTSNGVSRTPRCPEAHADSGSVDESARKRPSSNAAQRGEVKEDSRGSRCRAFGELVGNAQADSGFSKDGDDAHGLHAIARSARDFGSTPGHALWRNRDRQNDAERNG